jgi:hypothetical protein
MLRSVMRVVLVAALSMAAPAAAGLGSCGSDDTEGANAATVTRNAARVADLYRRIMGNIAERTAGERLAYHGLQDPIQACATAAGLPDLRPPFIDIYTGRSDSDLTVAFSGDGWLTPISTESFGLAADSLRLSAAQSDSARAPADRLSPADRERYEKIQDSCEPPASAYTGVQFPAGAVDLNQALDEMIGAVTARAPVKDLTAGYAGCMRGAGFADVPNPTALSRKLTGESPARDAMPLDGRPASPAWEAYLARERKAAKADAGCRRGLYDQAMIALGPDLDRFESDHAAEIAEVRRRWDELVASAGKLSP